MHYLFCHIDFYMCFKSIYSIHLIILCCDQRVFVELILCGVLAMFEALDTRGIAHTILPLR